MTLNADRIKPTDCGIQTYIDDLVNGLIKLMNSNYNLPVNLGKYKSKAV